MADSWPKFRVMPRKLTRQRSGQFNTGQRTALFGWVDRPPECQLRCACGAVATHRNGKVGVCRVHKDQLKGDLR